MSLICDICADGFNRSTRKELTCDGCEASCCTKCFETYVTSSNKDPNCMFCYKVFDCAFFKKNTSIALQKRVKTHREKVLLDREKAKLPETMEKYFKYDADIDNLSKEIVLLSIELIKINDVYTRYLTGSLSIMETQEHNSEQGNIELRRHNLINEIGRKRYAITRWKVFEKYTYQVQHESENIQTIESTYKILCQCPETECKGFVYTTGKCGVCDVTICKECRCVKDLLHECNESDIETVKMLRSDSKACPKCATLIFKISGCDQMWCTQCHTAFDWKSGKVEISNIHNPHYFQWLHHNRGTGGEGDQQENLNPCGGRINYGQLFEHLDFVCVHHYEYLISIGEMYRLRSHIENVLLYKLRSKLRLEPEKENLDMRLKWLKNEITEKKWMLELQKREKSKLSITSNICIFEMVTTVINDLFHRMLHINTPELFENTFIEFRTILEHANKLFKDTNYLYNLKVPRFIYCTTYHEWTV